MSSRAQPVSTKQEGYSDSGTYLADQLQRAELWYQCELESAEARRQTPANGKRMTSSVEDQVNGVSAVDALQSLEMEIDQRCQHTEDFAQPIHAIARRCKLSDFESDLLVLLLAHELDPRFAALSHYLQDGRSEQPSVELAVRLLCKGLGENFRAHAILSGNSPLFALPLATENGSGLYRTLILNEQVTQFVLGAPVNSVAPALANYASWYEIPEDIVFADELSQQVQNLVEQQAANLCWLIGPRGAGKRTWAATIAHALGRRLLVADLAVLRLRRELNAACLQELRLEARLHNALLLLHDEHPTLERAAEEAEREALLVNTARSWQELVLMAASRPSQHAKPRDYALMLETPPLNTRLQLWQKIIKKSRPKIAKSDLDRLAQFKFTPGQIIGAVEFAQTRALQTGRRQSIDLLLEGCKHQAASGLAQLSDRIHPQYGWNDLVVTAGVAEQLQELCDQVRLQYRVYEDWGLIAKSSRGRCVSALFSGPSGTGKTMAAEIIAKELKMDLAKVDLASVVSKYVGETEKNLSVIFDEAQNADIVLFFDESDALFGKRTEVKDSHDRYANIEINYLLQRIETFDGVLLLSTNQRSHLDDAFTRRLRFSIEFAPPREHERSRLWQLMLPRQVPQKSDLDFDFLAQAFEVTGGTIRNASLTAAFLAAKENSCVSMEHLVLAVRREYQKAGRICTEAEFGRFYPLVADGLQP